MSRTNHVSGECLLRTGTGGSNALEDLGYTVDGVDLEFHRHTSDVKADTGGGEEGVPVDVQEMGKEAFIRAQLVSYDEAVLAKIRKDADETTEGGLATIGRLLGANGHLFRLLLTSPSEAVPWNFPTVYLHDSASVKLGTKRTIWNLTFRAIAYIGIGTSKDVVLYNRTTSG